MTKVKKNPKKIMGHQMETGTVWIVLKIMGPFW